MELAENEGIFERVLDKASDNCRLCNPRRDLTDENFVNSNVNSEESEECERCGNEIKFTESITSVSQHKIE